MFQSLILFHRRLIVLTAVFTAVLIVLLYQVCQLTLWQGQHHFEKAQGRLHDEEFLPTWRGQIIDRKGRVIAEDVASYDVAIEWDLITGDYAQRFAREDAIASVERKTWKSMSPEERQSLVDSFLPTRNEELRSMWSSMAQLGNVDPDVFDRRLANIYQEVEHTAHVVWARQEEMHKRRYGEGVPFEKDPIREQREPHVVLPRVSDEIAMKFTLLDEPYIDVTNSRERAYPYRSQQVVIDRSTLPRPMRQRNVLEIELDGIAELIVGKVRGEAWAEDIARRPFRSQGVVDLGGYRADDEVGDRGLESSLEHALRGTRGRIVRNRDGKELSRSQPVGGNNVQVTLDIELQARVEAVLSPKLGLMLVQKWHRNTLPKGTPLRGAVVVLDVETSQVLAMASTPALRDEMDVEGYPWLNRASKGLYPPGSIIKPLLLVAAVTEGKLQPEDSIECTGHFFKGVTHAARCWIYRSQYNYQMHGKLQPIEAIAKSCNIFFYELGTRLGFSGLLDWLQRFGMSKPLAAQLTHADATGSQGHFPSTEDIESLRQRGALAFETVSVSIGQGALTWSPLHAAAAFATLARGGIWKSPTIVVGAKQNIVDLQLDPRGVQLALAGLHDSVTKDYGTGSKIRYSATDNEPTFNIDGVHIWGKTGTAEAPPYFLTKDSTPLEGLDHSWFLVMASPLHATRPSIVVAVLVEHGGSGGRVAGPIANQILFALQAEGYLGQRR